MEFFSVEHEAAIVEAQHERAAQVKKEIKRLQGTANDAAFELADFLAEAVDRNYLTLWGYPDLSTFLEDSELDVKQRQAESLIRISRESRRLGIDREKLRFLKIGKLKAIFSLQPWHFNEDQEKYKARVIELIDEAANKKLTEIESMVRLSKGIDEAPTVTRCVKYDVEAWENVIKPAREKARAAYGHDITDGYADEMICAAYLAEADEEQWGEIYMDELAGVPDEVLSTAIETFAKQVDAEITGHLGDKNGN